MGYLFKDKSMTLMPVSLENGFYYGQSGIRSSFKPSPVSVMPPLQHQAIYVFCMI